MTVDSSGSTQQMQMSNMYGRGGGKGNGNGGMKDIMQSLSQEDRTQLRDEMSSLSKQDRQDAIAQMQKVDKSGTSDQDYFQSLLDILNQNEEANSQTNTTDFTTYA